MIETAGRSRSMSHSNLMHWHTTPKCDQCGEEGTLLVNAFEIHVDCNIGDPVACEDHTNVLPEDFDRPEEHWLPRAMKRACMDTDVGFIVLCQRCWSTIIQEL